MTSAAARLTVNAIAAQAATAARPCNDQSPWNARPTKLTLGSDEVPKSSYFPNIAEGAYSLGVFTASATDPAVTVKGNYPGGIWLPDAEAAAPQVVVERSVGRRQGVGDAGRARRYRVTCDVSGPSTCRARDRASSTGCRRSRAAIAAASA